MSGLVLDVSDSNLDPGTLIRLRPQTGGRNQLFRFDTYTGDIRNRIRDFVLDFNGDKLAVNPYYVDSIYQRWEPIGEFLVHPLYQDTVLEIEEFNYDTGATVVKSEITGYSNQSWEFIPVA